MSETTLGYIPAFEGEIIGFGTPEQEADAPMSECVNGAADPWEDIDGLWAAELWAAPDSKPSPGEYRDGINPNDWALAEHVARHWKRNANDRALAVSAVDKDIAELQGKLRALEATKAEVSKTFDRREEYLKHRYFDFLQAFTTAATEGKRERYVQIVNTRLSLTHKSASIAVVDEEAAIKWAAENAPEAIKTSLLKTPLNKWFTSTGEAPAGCELVPESDAFSMKVGG